MYAILTCDSHDFHIKCTLHIHNYSVLEKARSELRSSGVLEKFPLTLSLHSVAAFWRQVCFHVHVLKPLPGTVVNSVHWLCRSQLYAAYLIPPQPPPPAQKKGQPPSGIGKNSWSCKHCNTVAFIYSLFSKSRSSWTSGVPCQCVYWGVWISFTVD